MTPEQAERVVAALERIATAQTIHVGYTLVAAVFMLVGVAFTGLGFHFLRRKGQPGQEHVVMQTPAVAKQVIPPEDKA